MNVNRERTTVPNVRSIVVNFCLSLWQRTNTVSVETLHRLFTLYTNPTRFCRNHNVMCRRRVDWSNGGETYSNWKKRFRRIIFYRNLYHFLKFTTNLVTKYIFTRPTLCNKMYTCSAYYTVCYVSFYLTVFNGHHVVRLI